MKQIFDNTVIHTPLVALDEFNENTSEKRELQIPFEYFFSPPLKAFMLLACERLKSGHGCALYLEGPPGGGKTSFAKALAQELDAKLFYYSGAPDKERDLLYTIDVGGVLRRDNAWKPGAAWQAFEYSRQGKNAVLLIDEVDKTNPGFDAFLLRLLEEWSFRSPEERDIIGDPRHIAVVLTSNGKRQLRTEVLRRAPRMTVPFPEHDRLIQIMDAIARQELPRNLSDITVRLGNAIRAKDPDLAPSPKELALCCVDLLSLKEHGVRDPEVWRQIAAGWMIKKGGAASIDAIVKQYKWWRAIITESYR